MKLSNVLGERYKEKPADANTKSHIFLLKGGYIRQVANGIYSLLPIAKRIITKIENIIREEMDVIDGQEVLMPVVMPKELWEESGRYQSIGSELVKFKDRTQHDMLLGMTHEEAAVHLCRKEATSHNKYPFMIYQIQTKFRDEPRSRGGLIRVREFTMKDAYSFHTSVEDLNEYYDKCLKAYHKIFSRVGLPEVISVGSDTGMMGGSIAHEFMLLCDSGEDTIAICDNCDYKANMEVAESRILINEAEELEREEVKTPGIKTIAELKDFFTLDENKFMKASVFIKEGNECKKNVVVVFVRGDLEVNEAKLKKVVKCNVFPLEESDTHNLCFGFIGPIGLDENLEVIFDKSLKNEKNIICGSNKEDYHIKNLSIERDVEVEEFFDVSKVKNGDKCSKCDDGNINLSMGIEVGNIFQLGTKYTESMEMTYTDINGRKQTPIMGCYGIGVGRLMASIIEAKADEDGPIWSYDVAPWQIHICVLNIKKQNVKDEAFELYKKLKKLNLDVLIDDRNVNAGVQFADADLLGVPIRIIVSPRNLKEGSVEIATRDKKFREKVLLDDVEIEIKKLVEKYSSLNKSNI